MNTMFAFVGYIILTLLLLGMLLTYRSSMVAKGDREANAFNPDGSDVPPLLNRITRAYHNCLEGFSFIGGLMLFAIASNQIVITNSLALVLLMARFGQVITHLLSTAPKAVQIRFGFFVVQLGICAYWCVMFLLAFT